MESLRMNLTFWVLLIKTNNAGVWATSVSYFRGVGHGRRLKMGEGKRFSLTPKDQTMNGDV